MTENDKNTGIKDKDIFAGSTFSGEPVSKEKYIQHYAEYVKRCGAIKKVDITQATVGFYVSLLAEENKKSPEMIEAISRLFQVLIQY